MRLSLSAHHSCCDVAWLQEYRAYIWVGTSLWHYIGIFLPSSKKIQAITLTLTGCSQAIILTLTLIGCPQAMLNSWTTGDTSDTLFIPLHLEHYVERHSLMIIIVLGELP